MSHDPQAYLDQLKAAEQSDQEWLNHVYRGDKEKDLTIRAVVAGMIFGGLMALSNLYVGLKSGWGLGVDIAAVIVIFAVFKGLRGIGLVKKEFGMLECTTMMTVAVAASWISSAGLVSAVPALTMLTGYEFVWWQLTLFIAVILFLGLFMAIPLKRQMIQVDSLRFPANIPTGETLKAIYAHGNEGMKKAKAMGIAGVLGMMTAGLRDGLAWIPAQLNLPYHIGRVGMDKLTMGFEPSLIFLSIGALFGMKVGISMLGGMILNYGILAPDLINAKVIQHAPPQIRAATPPKLPLTVAAGQTLTVTLVEAKTTPELTADATTSTLTYTWSQPVTYGTIDEIQRDLSAPTLQDGAPNPLFKVVVAGTVTNKATKTTQETQSLTFEAPGATKWEARLSIPKDQPSELVETLGFKPGATVTQAIGGFRNISAWSLWPGATVLVVGGLLALAFQWRTLGRTFASIFTTLGNRKNAPQGVLDHLEIPMTWFLIGFAVTGILAMALLAWLFQIHWWMGLIAVLMTFFLAAVAARAGAEIGINPIGALGKVTQLTYGVMAPGNIPANLMTAGVTAGAACSCSDTVGNLKVGHMVGANPRKQFIAQIFGVVAGSLIAVPAYFILVPDPTVLGGDKFPAPSALVWMGVAKVLSQGLGTLPASAVHAIIVAFIVGVIIVLVDRFFPKARPYTPSPAALGIALTIPGSMSFAMFLGAFIVWILEKKAPKWNATYTIPIASGCIAGESIMGVILAVLLALGLT
jgi:uncharacterized oligopeptide transporter (OPT) family protein